MTPLTPYVILAGLVGFITSILWLIIGWRAMKAHESLAESLALLSRETSRIRDGLSDRETKRGPLPKLTE